MGMPTEPHTHEPLDYQHFESMTTNRRPWGDTMPGLVLGECVQCRSSITYPGPSDKPPCYTQATGLKSEAVEALELVSAGIRLFNDIPVSIQGILERYVKGHVFPGSCIRGLLSGDQDEFEMRADDEVWAAREFIWRWLEVAAPPESWGDEDSVTAWLMAKPATTEKTQ